MRFSFKLTAVCFFIGTITTFGQISPQNQTIGQHILIGFTGTTVAEMDSGIKRAIEEGLAGGVILFDKGFEKGIWLPICNIASVDSQKKLTTLISDLRTLSPFGKNFHVCIDQEGGQVARLNPKNGFNSTSSARELGMVNNPEKTYEAAHAIAEELNPYGFNWNFAPVVDVQRADNFIAKKQRMFSENPNVVTANAAAYVDACRAEQILSSLKHFPGHGSALNDTHEGFGDISATWNTSELIPFVNLIKSQKADSVMVAHVFLKKAQTSWGDFIENTYPASLSRVMVYDLLRTAIGYNGVVLTDDLSMGAITKHYPIETAVLLALKAGNDIVEVCHGINYEILFNIHNKIQAALDSGELNKEEWQASEERIQKLSMKN
jgi:beta-N-acetylhexosaminidase